MDVSELIELNAVGEMITYPWWSPFCSSCSQNGAAEFKC